MQNKIIRFIKRVSNSLDKNIHPPLNLSISSLIADHQINNIKDHFGNFSTFITREDAIGAAHYINQIMDAGFQIEIEIISQSSIRFHISNEPQKSFQELSNDLLKVDIYQIHGVCRWGLLAIVIASAQTLFRRQEFQQSKEFLHAWLGKYGPNHLISDIALAQEWADGYAQEIEPLINSMAAGGLEYIEYFKGRYCNKPFDEFEIRSDGEIFVCCPSFLPYSIGNINKSVNKEELKRSKDFSKIKDSIVRQDFRYCRWLHCTTLKNGLPSINQNPKLDYEPVNFRLSYDPTCNLWCPSCRKEKIVASGQEREKLLSLTDEIILPFLKKGNDCMMNGYGDIFASKACRRILEIANRKDFPKLKFSLISNGVLFTPEEWGKFPGIHDMVRSVRISIDASCKSTYDIVRLGGDWDILEKNLKFISELREDGIIQEFMLSFVVQACNFKEMPEFAKMGKILGCDFVVFEPIMNWNTFTESEFKERAVHYKSHPQYHLFISKRAELLTVIPPRTRENLIRHRQPDCMTLASGSLLAGLE